jgi:pyruvate ferredoxin oxidoreductase delta subunit
MDIDRADVILVLDDTMGKGVESWGHYGIRPINEKIVLGGTLVVISKRGEKELTRYLERKPYNYKLAILPGERSFAVCGIIGMMVQMFKS